MSHQKLASRRPRPHNGPPPPPYGATSLNAGPQYSWCILKPRHEGTPHPHNDDPSLATLTCNRTEYQCIITSQTAPQLNLQLQTGIRLYNDAVSLILTILPSFTRCRIDQSFQTLKTMTLHNIYKTLPQECKLHSIQARNVPNYYT